MCYFYCCCNSGVTSIYPLSSGQEGPPPPQTMIGNEELQRTAEIQTIAHATLQVAANNYFNGPEGDYWEQDPTVQETQPQTLVRGPNLNFSTLNDAPITLENMNASHSFSLSPSGSSLGPVAASYAQIPKQRKSVTNSESIQLCSPPTPVYRLDDRNEPDV